MQHAYLIVFAHIWTDNKMYDFSVREMNNLIICNLNLFRFNAIQDCELRFVDTEMMSDSWVKNSDLSRYIFNFLSSNLHDYSNFEHHYSIFYLDWFSSLTHVLKLLILISWVSAIWSFTRILDSTAAFIMIWLFTMWAFLSFWLTVRSADLTVKFTFLISFLLSWEWHWRFDFIRFDIQNWMSINKIWNTFCLEFCKLRAFNLLLQMIEFRFTDVIKIKSFN